MNSNTNEPNQLLPIAAPPEGITRRSFIKRTASTALVVALAMGAFENEARAEDASSNSAVYELELTGWPEANITYSEPSGYQELEFFDVETTQQATLDGYTWILRTITRVTPNTASNTLVAGAYHYISPTAFGVTITVTIAIWKGTTLLSNRSGLVSGTLGASLISRNTPEVEGFAERTTLPVFGYLETLEGQGYWVA